MVNDLISAGCIELDLISVSGSELTWFLGVEKYFGFFVSGFKLGFCVGAPRLTLFESGDPIDMISVLMSELT